MRLDRLTVRGFRNYTDHTFFWHPQINIIYGSNAQGKTNLLEAISYLSAGASFRGQNEEKLLNWDSDFFFLEAELEREDRLCTVSAGYQQRKKLWKKNGAPCRRVSEIVGFLHTVIFTPEDLEIVKKGPELRRNFLDREMLQMFHGYHRVLNQYKKALFQRNNLLKQLAFSGKDEQEALLAPWESQLATGGALILQKRAFIIDRLNEIAAPIHRRLSGGAETLCLSYEPALPDTSILPREEEILAERLAEALVQRREEDLRRGFTTCGPHRDDLKISINGVDARYYGSQGQQKTAALSVKLSEPALVREINGYYPILLLDDVLSELDKNRRAALLELALGKSQIFLTTTDIDQELLATEADRCRRFHICHGRLQEENTSALPK